MKANALRLNGLSFTALMHVTALTPTQLVINRPHTKIYAHHHHYTTDIIYRIIQLGGENNVTRNIYYRITI